MDQNLAVMLQQLCYGKISFIVLVPGPSLLPSSTLLWRDPKWWTHTKKWRLEDWAQER